MQHLPDRVLQELQQQGEGEIEQQGRDVGEASTGGRGMASQSPAETSETSLPFPSPNGADAPSSPATFFRETSPSPGESSQRLSRRRFGPFSQESPSESPYHRSGTGSRAPTSPFGTSTAPAIPPQLLGRRVGAHADILKEGQAKDALNSTIDYHRAHQLNTAEQLRTLLSAKQPLGLDSHLILPSRISNRKSSPSSALPGDTSDSSGSSTASKDSSQSAVSSLAYIARDSRVDRRLFSKKSIPAAHLVRASQNEQIGSESSSPLPHTKDKLDVEATKANLISPGNAPSSVPNLKPATPSSPSLRPPSPRVRSSARHIRVSHSSGSIEYSIKGVRSHIHKASQPALRLSSATKTHPAQHVSFAKPVSPLSEGLAGTESPRLQLSRQVTISFDNDALRGRPSEPALAAKLPTEKHYHDVTPPEADPGTPQRSQFQSGDSYFRPFGGSTFYKKGFTPTMVPEILRQSAESGSSRPINGEQYRSPIAQESLRQSKRKRSSVFKLFRKPAITENICERSAISKVGPSSPAIRDWPNDALPSSFETPSEDKCKALRRAPSPSYFNLGRARRQQRSSESTPQSGRSAVSTSEDSDRRRHPSDLHSSHSTGDMSPMTKPQPRQRLRHRHTLASMEEDDDESAVINSNQKLVQVLRTSTTSKQQPGSLMGVIAGNQEPTIVDSETLRSLQTDHGRQSAPGPTRNRLVKGTHRSLKDLIVSGNRKRKSDEQLEENSVHAPDTKRHRGIMHNASMSTLLRKVSIPHISKLKHMTSSHSTMRLRGDRNLRLKTSLEVTEFYQTPFSQRYGNTRRAEAAVIRTLVNDTLSDDDIDDDLAVLDLNVPDHLPSSPLCPLNPGHRSGGKAVCPQHGRKRLVSRPSVKHNSSDKIVKVPTIVYEGGREPAAQNVTEGYA